MCVSLLLIFVFFYISGVLIGLIVPRFILELVAIPLSFLITYIIAGLSMLIPYVYFKSSLALLRQRDDDNVEAEDKEYTGSVVRVDSGV